MKQELLTIESASNLSLAAAIGATLMSKEISDEYRITNAEEMVCRRCRKPFGWVYGFDLESVYFWCPECFLIEAASKLQSEERR